MRVSLINGMTGAVAESDLFPDFIWTGNDRLSDCYLPFLLFAPALASRSVLVSIWGPGWWIGSILAGPCAPAGAVGQRRPATVLGPGGVGTGSWGTFAALFSSILLWIFSCLCLSGWCWCVEGDGIVRMWQKGWWIEGLELLECDFK